MPLPAYHVCMSVYVSWVRDLCPLDCILVSHHATFLAEEVELTCARASEDKYDDGLFSRERGCLDCGWCGYRCENGGRGFSRWSGRSDGRRGSGFHRC